MEKLVEQNEIVSQARTGKFGNDRRASVRMNSICLRLQPYQAIGLKLLPYAVVVLAFAIQFWQLNARTFHGDELGSVADALGTRQNPQALSYFALLRLWLFGGTTEFWLRFPSALFAVSNVAVNYRAVAFLWSRRTALIFAILLATSPFVLGYGQQVRFYTWFLTTASASLWAFIAYLHFRTRRVLVLWLVLSLLMLTAHAMAFLVLGFELLTLWLTVPRLKWRYKFGSLVLVGGLLAAIALSPFHVVVYDLVAKYTDALSEFTGSRGLSVSQIAKLPLLLFFLTLGEAVYPLDWGLVVPGLLLYAGAIALGIYRLRKDRQVLLFFVLLAGMAPVLLFLVLDSLTPVTFAGAAPRYLIFLIPVFYFLAGWGIADFRRAEFVLIPFVLVNLLAVNAIWSRTWSYSDDLVDWRVVSKQLAGFATEDTVFIVEGRAFGNFEHHSSSEWHSTSFWDAEQSAKSGILPRNSRIILISENDQTETRVQLSKFLAQLASTYKVTDGWVQYPLFVYILDRKKIPADTFGLDAATGTIQLPVEFYGLEFQDLRLPQVGSVQVPMRIVGQFSLLPESIKRLPLDEPVYARQLFLVSTVTDANDMPLDTPVAQLRILFADGHWQTMPLRIGRETCAWNKSFGDCIPVLSWHKRVALVGARAYPEAWQDFQAMLYGTRIHLGSSAAVRELDFERLSSAGRLSIWGIGVSH
jgi:uncharacterized membrane protein